MYQNEEERAAYDDKWGKLEQSMPADERPIVPFQKDRLIRDYNEIYYKIYDKVKAVEM